MIVEVKVSRTWQVWIDGEKSIVEWSISEGEEVGGDHSETYYRYYMGGLSIGGRNVEWIAFDIADTDWVVDIDHTRLGPTEGWIKFAGDAEPVYLNVEECYYIGEDTGPITRGVKTESGEWVEIDETVAFVRLATVSADKDLS